MLDAIRKKLRDRRYGPPVIIVSGLPRSGTSMMMKMLEAGGLPIMTDGQRKPDIDNPKGYYEYERVKNLEHETDKSYIREARGKVLKVISFLIRFLPDDNQYRVILMRRDLDEVLASQNKMIRRLGAKDSTDPERLREQYMNDIARARLHCRNRPNFEMIEVNYRRAIEDPEAVARQVAEFLGMDLDVRAMAEAVDPSLYRNRKEQVKGAGA